MCGVAYEGMGSWMVGSKMSGVTNSTPFVRRAIGGHISFPERELVLLLALQYEHSLSSMMISAKMFLIS